MKKYLLTPLFLMAIHLATNAQSTEKFIRIVGNSSYEIKSNTTRVYFTISENSRYDKNTKTEKTSYDSVYTKVASELKKIGIKETDFFSIIKPKNQSSYGSEMKSKSYYVDVNDKIKLEKLIDQKIIGFRIDNVKYLYSNSAENKEIEFAKKAIEDAERKAKSLAKSIGKSVGKVLNLEDKNTTCCSNIGEYEKETFSGKYTVNITFELLD